MHEFGIAHVRAARQVGEAVSPRTSQGRKRRVARNWPAPFPSRPARSPGLDPDGNAPDCSSPRRPHILAFSRTGLRKLRGGRWGASRIRIRARQGCASPLLAGPEARKVAPAGVTPVRCSAHSEKENSQRRWVIVLLAPGAELEAQTLGTTRVLPGLPFPHGRPKPRLAELATHLEEAE